MNNNTLIRELFNDQLKSSNAKQLGLEHKSLYSAEQHPEQAEMLDILGTVINKLIADHQEEDAQLVESINTICLEAPQKLQKVDTILQKSIIDINSLRLNM